MDDYENLSHSVWGCKYHAVFIPKCRRKVIYCEPRRELGMVFRALARKNECEVEESHLMADHVHMLISIRPDHSVPSIVGYVKGKSPIHIARTYFDRKRNYFGQDL